MKSHFTLDDSAKKYLAEHEHKWLIIDPERECVGANCSTSFTQAHIHFSLPKDEYLSNYDGFEDDGFTVYINKSLEIVPELKLTIVHHLLHNTLKLEGFPEGPEITHYKL